MRMHTGPLGPFPRRLSRGKYLRLGDDIDDPTTLPRIDGVH